MLKESSDKHGQFCFADGNAVNEACSERKGGQWEPKDKLCIQSTPRPVVARALPLTPQKLADELSCEVTGKSASAASFTPLGTLSGLGSCAGILSEAEALLSSLLSRARSEADALENSVAAARARAAALEAELETVQLQASARERALEASLKASFSAREEKLAAALSAQQKLHASVLNELAEVRAKLQTRADFSRQVSGEPPLEGGDNPVPRSVELKDNSDMQRRLIQCKQVIAKQQERIKEHEARLKSIGERRRSSCRSALKRKRDSLSVLDVCADGSTAVATKGKRIEVDGPEILDDAPAPTQPAATRLLPSPRLVSAVPASEVTVVSKSSASVSGIRDSKDDCASALNEHIPGLRIYNTRPHRLRKVQSSNLDVNERRSPAKAELQQATALERCFSAPALKRCLSRSPSSPAISAERIPEELSAAAEQPPPMELQCPPPPRPFKASSPSRKVRASGADAVTASNDGQAGPLCRCTVRGKQFRLGLKAFDCEQCRAFYEATGVSGSSAKAKRAWRAGTSSSRHRFEHAPTNTPDGFWDLSFPDPPPERAIGQ
jgi:hypothetical protein